MDASVQEILQRAEGLSSQELEKEIVKALWGEEDCFPSSESDTSDSEASEDDAEADLADD